MYMYVYVCMCSMYMYIYVYRYVYIYTYIHAHTHMLFTTEGFFEVAIESWPEWDLNPQPMNSDQTL